ncbi:hypothetical protein [Methylibium sp. Root1272]|uniref:hypothetical protein n=1 Tax=Methylibium sp. Root1272 TaxID=1736441 RepID=UPI0006F2705E|nr:hypothetical protein [Methylibium sp. Root1272]KQW76334.1 hypothetical protein ASC67_01275 [Methylibium sp. Root1272]
MIDLLGFLYEIGKDLKEHHEWKEEDKLVDLPWVQKSGFDKSAEANGYKLCWSRPDRIESLKLDGYEVMFELDRSARTRRRLVARDGLVLVGKKT